MGWRLTVHGSTETRAASSPTSTETRHVQSGTVAALNAIADRLREENADA